MGVSVYKSLLAGIYFFPESQCAHAVRYLLRYAIYSIKDTKFAPGHAHSTSDLFNTLLKLCLKSTTKGDYF